MAVAQLPITPHSLLNAEPCANCDQSSMSLLLAGIAVMLAALAGEGAKTTSELLDEAACFRCIADSPHKLAVAISTILGERAVQADVIASFEEVQEKAKCLLCAAPGDVKAIIVYELAKWVHNMGVLL